MMSIHLSLYEREIEENINRREKILTLRENIKKIEFKEGSMKFISGYIETINLNGKIEHIDRQEYTLCTQKEIDKNTKKIDEYNSLVEIYNMEPYTFKKISLLSQNGFTMGYSQLEQPKYVTSADITFTRN